MVHLQTSKREKIVDYLSNTKELARGDYGRIAKMFAVNSDFVRHIAMDLGLPNINTGKQCKRNDYKKEVAVMKKKQVTFDAGIKAILDNVNDKNVAILPPVKVKNIDSGRGDEEETVLVLSDWQLGHKTDTFNFEIAKERVQKMVTATLKIVALHRKAYPIRKIHLFCLGDFIQSDKVGYLVDQSELEGITMTQVFGQAVPLLSWTIQELLKNFDDVYVHCTRGNHGRGEKGTSDMNNWDDVIYKVVETKFSENERVHFNVAEKFYQIVDIQGTKFLLTHGDQVKGGSYGIPLYALLSRMLRWATSIPQKWDVLVVGHWHCYGNVDQNGQELFVNGTLVSDDEYVRKSYGWNGSTIQILFSVHKRKGITWRYQLKLLK